MGLVEAKDYLAEAAVLEEIWILGEPGPVTQVTMKWLIYKENLQYDFQKALHPNVFAMSFAQNRVRWKRIRRLNFIPKNLEVFTVSFLILH